MLKDKTFIWNYLVISAGDVSVTINIPPWIAFKIGELPGMIRSDCRILWFEKINSTY